MLLELFLLVVIDVAHAGCTTDMECKGDRICEQGVCVSPPTSTSATVAPTSTTHDVRIISWDDADTSSTDIISGFRFPRSARVLVAPFRDNESDDPRDSVDTGIIAQQRLLEGLEELDSIRVKKATPQRYDPSKGLSLDEAVALAHQYEADFVVFGDVIEFYRVAPLTFRADRAGVTIRVASVSGQLVFQRSWNKHSGTNFSTPDAVIENIGERFRDEVAPD